MNGQPPGYVPNDESEAHVPISRWALYLIADEALVWVVGLGVQTYRLTKHGGAMLMPPDPAPVAGDLATWLIPNDLAHAMGLPLPEEAPVGPKRMARMSQSRGPSVAAEAPPGPD